MSLPGNENVSGIQQDESSLEAKLSQLTTLVLRLAATQQTQTQSASSSSSTSTAARFSFDAYSPSSSEEIEDYFERFELKLSLCNVPRAQWANQARVHMDPELNASLNALCFPSLPSSLNFETLKSKLIAHHVKSRDKLSEAINFRQIFQRDGESISAFVSRLKIGARYCEFGDFLDYSLTVQFIHGLQCDDIRDEIFLKKPETFDSAVTVGLSMESLSLSGRNSQRCSRYCKFL